MLLLLLRSESSGTSGTIAATLDATTAVATGTPVVIGSGTGTLNATTAVATGTPVTVGVGTGALADATALVQGSPVVAGQALSALADAQASTVGTPAVSGSASHGLADAVATASGSPVVGGTVESALGSTIGDAAGAPVVAGAVAATLDPASGEAYGDTGNSTVTGFVLATLDDTTGVGIGFPAAEDIMKATGVQAFTGTSIQSVISSVESSGYGAVALPAGTYNLTAPVRIHNSNMELYGYLGRAVLASNNSFYGPMLHIGPSRVSTLPLAPPLLGGAGNSIQIGPAMAGVFDLRQGAGLDLNGVTSLCVEFAIRPDSLTDFRHIFGSFGIRRAGEAAQSISLGHTSGGALSLLFRCGEVNHTITAPSGSLAIGQTSIIAIDYDGATLRLFVDGVMASSESATGGINQAAHEGVFLGALPSTWPDGGAIFADGLAARIDAFRVSASRRTGNHTPPSTKGGYGEFGPIRCELLTTELYDDFVVGRMLNAPLYLRLRAPAVPSLSDVRVTNLGFLGGVANGIEAEATVRLTLDDINTPLSACRDSIRLRENTFLARLTRIAMTSSHLGVSFAGACGVSVLRDSDITAGTYGVVAFASGLRIDNIYVSGCANWSCWFHGGGGSTTTISCSFMVTTDEGRASAPEGGVYMTDTPITDMNGCTIDVATFDTSAIGIRNSRLSGAGNHIKQNPAGSAVVVRDDSSPALAAGSVRLSNTYRWQPSRPWSNTANLVSEP